MINLYAVLIILFFHWLADFVFQKEVDQENKYKSILHLLSHTLIYTLVMSLAFCAISMNQTMAIWLCIVAFLLHTFIDYFTSKLNHKLWENGKTHYFFVSIGFDQFLHLSQLLITYYLLVQ